MTFTDSVKIIGVNPYVIPPKKVLTSLFTQSRKTTSPIPVCGTLNGHSYKQTLVKYRGTWRFYLNTPMRRSAGIDVGDSADVRIAYDPKPRNIRTPTALKNALKKNSKALAAFEKLVPSRRKEIVRYVASLKSDEAVERNLKRVIRFLSGRSRFVGREKS